LKTAGASGPAPHANQKADQLRMDAGSNTQWERCKTSFTISSIRMQKEKGRQVFLLIMKLPMTLGTCS